MNRCGSRPCYCTILLRAEDTVAGVAQAGDDVAVVVQLLVQGADIDVHIGVGLMQGLQALGRGHQADELNVLGTALFDLADGVTGAAAGGQHRVQNKDSRSLMSLGSLQ